MIEGPLGGPRPLADSERRVIVIAGVRDRKITDNMRRKLESDLGRELIQYVNYESRAEFLDVSHRKMQKRYSLMLPESTSSVLEIVVMVNDNTVQFDTIKNIEEATRKRVNKSAFSVAGVSTTVG